MRSRKTQASTLRKPLRTITHELISPSDYERLAPEFIEDSALAHIAGGGGLEQTLKANTQALASIEIFNRVLQSYDNASTQTTLFGQQFRHPILLAPVASQALVNVEGELATAAGAAAQQAGLVVSTQASKPMEEIAAQTDAPKWFQLYFQHSRDSTKALIERAEDAGFSAIMVTLDTPIQTPSHRASRSKFVMPDHVRAVNLDGLPSRPQTFLQPDQSIIFQGMMSEAPSWGDLAWLLKQTSLPIIAKGITHPQDAECLIEMGICSIAVSNHGGRALDGMPASIHCLPLIRNAVGENFPLLFDGGIRSGYDVFKAIAKGANAVMIGRLQIYALAVAGSLGVAHLLKMIREELELAMSLTGCTNIESICQNCLFTNETS